jgi:3-deoxy-manno-octulosonate cytidylyltransferase (CMP-KDO synthetase)
VSTAPIFTVLIPARLASTRLPNKPLADIAGLPMVVRVARQAHLSQAARVVVAADDASIVQACAAHGVEAILTRQDHLSGSDRLAEAAAILGLADDALVVNVQGDEPLIDPALINAVAQTLADAPQAAMASAACAITRAEELHNPNAVKVVLAKNGQALYFSRSLLPYPREAAAAAAHPALRHIGIYAYRAGFITQFTQLEAAPLEQIESLEQLRALWHGYAIAMHISASEPAAGVDTPEDLERVRQHFAT